MHVRGVALIAVLSVLGLAGALAQAPAPPRCYAEWAEAALIVRKEALVAVDRLQALTRSRIAGELVKSTLCQEQGRWVYRAVVRGAGGELKSLIIDAQRPFER
jgi:hypothetical protein